MKNKFREYDIQTAFLSCTSEQRLKITSALPDVFFMYVGTSEGEECSNNTFYANPTNENYVKGLVRYINSLNTEQLLIIGSKYMYNKYNIYRYGEYTRKLIVNDLKSYGYDSSKIVYIDLIDIDDDYLENVVNNISIGLFNYTTDNNNYIILACENIFLKPLLLKLNEHKLAGNPNTTIISLNLDELIIREIDPEKVL